jgi:hypothetical protein
VVHVLSIGNYLSVKINILIYKFNDGRMVDYFIYGDAVLGGNK